MYVKSTQHKLFISWFYFGFNTENVEFSKQKQTSRHRFLFKWNGIQIAFFPRVIIELIKIIPTVDLKVVKKVLIISGRTDVTTRNIKQPIVDNHGHSFTKKTFNCPRPIYCHHCLDLLNWKLINNGLNCEGELHPMTCDIIWQNFLLYEWF